jgi:hypothetical protein
MSGSMIELKKFIAVLCITLLILGVLFFRILSEKRETIGQAQFVGFQNSSLIFVGKSYAEVISIIK